MTYYQMSDKDMKSVADAIRIKGKTTGALIFPDGMVTAIGNIPTGGDTRAEDGLITRTIREYSNDRVTLIGNRALQFCQKLTTASFPIVTRVKDMGFSFCTSLTSVNLPEATTIDENAFFFCLSLPSIALPKVQTFGPTVFDTCSGLKKVILGSSTVAVAGANILKGADSAQIYVPDALVDQYKQATNWVTYADRIHPMSELPPEERI